jgi:hypothetical protein
MLVTKGAKLSTLRCGVKLVLRCRKSSGVNWRLVRLLIGLGSLHRHLTQPTAEGTCLCYQFVVTD